jgi:3'-phosphoadenosine 5'-phosphosulfate sulfotransferase (PAPS reductase)/FAD synthetase
MADMLGIDRRKDKENELYKALKQGNIPNTPIRVKQLCGVKCEQFGSMYDRSRYMFMLDAPFEVSNMCCKVMKKLPVHQYGKATGRVPMTAQMASESKLRTSNWVKNGCNAFNAKNPISNPMSFWTEQDVLLYIKENARGMSSNAYYRKVMRYGNKVVYRTTGATALYPFKECGAICSVYGEVVTDYEAMGQCKNQMSFADFGIFDNERPLLKTTGCKRTGCVLCGFGCHLEKEPNRFQMLKETHPKFHNLLYVLKNNGVTYAEAIDWVNEHGNMNIKY